MPKSASPKKASGAPKAKGAVRAKSGCYTCRIRRKKCDERPDELGRCETCVRLRLQCLGFGAKRPEWLRENNNVTDLREKIKTFLASQGMIKGHSGAGPRAVEQEQTLRLADDDHPTPSESPQSHILVLSEESPRGSLSAVRDHHEHEPELYPNSSYAGSSSTYDHQSSSSSSIFPHSASSNQLFLRPPTPTYGHAHPQDCITDGYSPDFSSYLMSHHTNHVVPWQASSFGNLYHLQLPLEAYDGDEGLSPDGLMDFSPLYPSYTEPLLQHYMDNVFRLQYQLADMVKLYQIIRESISRGDLASDAAILLANVHSLKVGGREQLLIRDGPAKKRYDALKAEFASRTVVNEGDAMAALHVISAFLFDGGRGEWRSWMDLGYRYCCSILQDRQRFHNYRDALIACSDQENFIIKTFFWFDVLAAVTTMQPPLFRDVINEIYNPNQNSGIVDTYTETALSMMKIMGCENQVLWALSEISALASWKERQHQEGKLSVIDLVGRARTLQETLATPTYQQGMSNHAYASTSTSQPEDEARHIASEIFRTAAIVYLQTIINNDYYQVDDVQRAVKECVAAFLSFKSENYQPDVRHIVVRSTVFAVFLCGCFTNVDKDWDILQTHLEDEGVMGNCNGVMELIKEVRDERRKDRRQPVKWRQALQKHSMLLV